MYRLPGLPGSLQTLEQITGDNYCEHGDMREPAEVERLYIYQNTIHGNIW